MRDPNRIYRYCNELMSLWLTTPDLRFGQLMSNFFVWLAAGEQYIDPFYLEDEEFFRLLRTYLAQTGGQQR